MRLIPVLTLAAAFALSAFTLPTTSDAVVTLSNESSSTIVFVYASVCDEDTWGDDLLPTDILEPGSSATITVSAGCWDLKAVTDGGEELEHFGIEIEEGAELEWTVSDE